MSIRGADHLGMKNSSHPKGESSYDSMYVYFSQFESNQFENQLL